MNSHVIMEYVSQIATGVMVTMTVETTVMKKDVVCTIYMYNVRCILMDK